MLLKKLILVSKSKIFFLWLLPVSYSFHQQRDERSEIRGCFPQFSAIFNYLSSHDKFL